MELVARVARTLSTLSGSQAAREAICKAAREAAQAKLAILFEADPRGRELVASAHDGLYLPRLRLPFAGEPSGAVRVFSSGEPFFAGHLVGNPSISQRVVEQLGVNSALFEPVMRNEVTIGVLVIAWEETMEELPERVYSLLELLAVEATVAIERADAVARLETVARTDDLTGLANRRCWEEELPRELARAAREMRPVCVAMIDLDRFKEYNDEHGHQAGDRLLKKLASTWREMLRPTDVVARYGGEEFSLVLPNCTLERGAEVVERLRQAASEGQTCSVGLTVWNGHEDAEGLVARADAALYEAKRKGRDRTVAATS
jgi:diguanylate cyclase (GGDEF)-like protein